MAQESITTAGNPIIRHKYTADPTAIVCNDTVYIYTGHDEAPAGHLPAMKKPTWIHLFDGQAYIFWGNSTCYYAKLKENMIELNGPIQIVNLPGFTEGAHIHKRNGWYYLSYGYEFPEKVAYAMSRNIDGPWKFKGILNEIAGNCETNRPAILLHL